MFIAPAFIYATINCMTFSPAINKGLTSALPGNKSYGTTRQCELRYDLDLAWAEVGMTANLHLQQKNCISSWPQDICWNEYNADIRVDMIAEMMGSCKIDNFEIKPTGDDVEGWIIEKIFPVIESSVKKELRKEIEKAIKEHPDFAEMCQRN